MWGMWKSGVAPSDDSLLERGGTGRRLQTLDLSGTLVTDLTPLGQLSALQTLNLYNTRAFLFYMFRLCR